MRRCWRCTVWRPWPPVCRPFPAAAAAAVVIAVIAHRWTIDMLKSPFHSIAGTGWYSIAVAAAAVDKGTKRRRLRRKVAAAAVVVFAVAAAADKVW